MVLTQPVQQTRLFSLLFVTALFCSACSEEATEAEAPVCPEETCYPVGMFLVDWHADTSNALRIRHSAEPERVLWQSTDETPLLIAAVSEPNIQLSRGSFTFDIERSSSCEGSQIQSVEQADDAIIIRGNFSDCDLDFSIRYTAQSDHRLRFETNVQAPEGGPTYSDLSLGWASAADEGFYGFGAQYNVLNLKGRALPIWCQEQGHGRGLEPLSEILNTASPGSAGDWSTSYTCVPYYLSTAGYGLVLENSEYIEFDMQEDDATRATVFAPTLIGQLMYGASPLEIVEAYTEYTGRMEPLPSWTQKGAIVRTHGGAEAAFDKVTQLDTAGAAVAALWVEDWAGTRDTLFGTRMWWNWEIDRTLYPEFEQMVADLRKEEIRTLIYFNPFLADVTEKDNAQRNLYLEGQEAGYLVKTPTGEPVQVGSGGFYAGMVDLTHPEATDWIKTIMHAMIDTGVSGWMADFGEALPIDIELHSGVDPTAYHNKYPFDWAKLNDEVAREADVRSDFLTFNRSGNARSPSVARAFWIGDQLVTWDDYDGFKTVVPALVSSGLSGYTLQHGEVGGWLSVNLGTIQLYRSQELFQRWLELVSFTALMRLHTTNLPDLNHQWNSSPETLVHFARMTQVFAALAPYRETLMAEAQERGIPIVRHLMLHYPNDPAVYDLMQQFMLGADFLIAPVVDEGGTSVSVYLPQGSWTHLWSGASYDQTSGGATITVDAPIGEPAVFFRSDSPWGADLQTALTEKGIL